MATMIRRRARLEKFEIKKANNDKTGRNSYDNGNRTHPVMEAARKDRVANGVLTQSGEAGSRQKYATQIRIIKEGTRPELDEAAKIMEGEPNIVVDWLPLAEAQDREWAPVDATLMRDHIAFATFHIFFQKEEELYGMVPFYNKDRVNHIRDGCELIRVWLDLDRSCPAAMFLTSLAIIREIFIMAETDKVRMYGLTRLRETFDSENTDVIFGISACFANHQETWRRLTEICQHVEDKMKYRFMEYRSPSSDILIREERQELQIRIQMRTDFMIPECCKIVRTGSAAYFTPTNINLEHICFRYHEMCN